MLRRISPFVLLAIFVAACTPAGGPTTTVDGSSVASQTTGPSSTEPASPSTEAAPTTSLTLPPGTEDLPEAVRRRIAELVALTEQLRGLSFTTAPTVTVVSPQELADRVRADISEQLEDVEADEALYRLLGLIGPDLDLGETYADLYGEQVAGFYDGDTGELVVPASAETLSPLEEATLVHELTHALTDQRFGMWDVYSEAVDSEEFDAAEAYLSLIEGDAYLTQILFAQQLSEEDRGRLLAEAFAADSAVFDRVPGFLQESLIFPYREGFGFVQRLYADGGFEAVDAAYGEPPLSTEQIIHPRDYRRDLPMPVTIPEWDPPPGYELVYDATWGEFGIRAMLSQQLDMSTTDVAAEGWGGDRYRLWFDGTDVIFVYRYRGDTAADAAELAEALEAYVQAAADPAGSVVVRREGADVVMVGVSDPGVGDLVDVFAP